MLRLRSFASRSSHQAPKDLTLNYINNLLDWHEQLQSLSKSERSFPKVADTNTHRSKLQYQDRPLCSWKFEASPDYALHTHQRRHRVSICNNAQNWHKNICTKQKILEDLVPTRCWTSEFQTPMHHPTFNFSKVVRPANSGFNFEWSSENSKCHCTKSHLLQRSVSFTFQINEATLNMWTPLQIEVLEANKMGEATHSSSGDQIIAAKTQRCEVRQSWIIRSAESLSEIQKPTLISSSSAHALPYASPPKSPCPTITPSMLMVVCRNNFPKQCTGPAKLEAATLTTACKRPQRDMAAQFYPAYFNGGDGCHLTVKVQCAQNGPKFCNWGQGKPWPISLA
jgi:hypothetical protein